MQLGLVLRFRGTCLLLQLHWIRNKTNWKIHPLRPPPTPQINMKAEGFFATQTNELGKRNFLPFFFVKWTETHCTVTEEDINLLKKKIMNISWKYEIFYNLCLANNSFFLKWSVMFPLSISAEPPPTQTSPAVRPAEVSYMKQNKFTVLGHFVYHDLTKSDPII